MYTVLWHAIYNLLATMILDLNYFIKVKLSRYLLPTPARSKECITFMSGFFYTRHHILKQNIWFNLTYYTFLHNKLSLISDTKFVNVVGSKLIWEVENNYS